MHLSATLANGQLDAKIFNTFITILYMYMFRAISSSSSGGQILFIQHLVSSLSVSDHPVHSCTARSLTESDDTRCCDNTIWPLEDEQDIARNMYMYRFVINVLKLCALSWSLSKGILRCTVRETSKHLPEAREYIWEASVFQKFVLTLEIRDSNL